jgi:hypothetical protein
MPDLFGRPSPNGNVIEFPSPYSEFGQFVGWMNKTLAKDFLTRLGRYVKPQWIHNANGVLNYLYAGWWMSSHGFFGASRFVKREELHAHLAQPLVEIPVTYLEFGVFRGDSLRRWASLLKHPAARFHGFDSFEGLPESWVLACGKGAFDVGGELPVIEDPRVQLHKGWFDQTLPLFVKDFQCGDRLVIHLDADLYSSSAFVLKSLRPWITRGTILVFDEFFDRQHELKAADEFIADAHVKLNCLGVTTGLQQVAFEVL